MPSPDYFDDNNFWKSKGAVILGTKEGSIGGSAADFANAKVEVPFHDTEGQYAAAIGTRGISHRPAADQDVSLEGVIAVIEGHMTGGWAYGGYMRGPETWEPTTWSASEDSVKDGMGVVALNTDDADDYYVGGVPPYPLTTQKIVARCMFRHNFWSNGTPVWTGDYYIELYEYAPGMSPGLPGNGDAPPVFNLACPPRPPWPYRDPVSNVTVPRAAKIRRSRP